MNKNKSLVLFVGELILLAFFLAACRVISPPDEGSLPLATLEEATTDVVVTTKLETQVPAPDEIPTQVSTPTQASGAQLISLSEMPVFALFRESLSEVVPVVDHERIAQDMSNVRVSFALSEPQLEGLAQRGFVVSPGVEKEFFTLYEKARYNNEPIFVTSDALLHVYHLLFDKVLRTTEVDYLIPLLRNLNRALLDQAEAFYQDLVGTDWETPALRTVAYVGVASKLLDPDVAVPEYARELMVAELENIAAAGGILPSPIFPGLQFGEDYTQYIPRGHYTRSDALQAYFRCMMWYGRMTFRLKVQPPEIGREETRAALLLVHALRNAQVGGRPALEAWEALYSPTVFFVGRSDDLTVVQYGDVIDAVYGPNPKLTTLADDARLDDFITLANELPPPRILGIVIADTADVEESTKGLRFMGQRFVPDAYIFRELIYRNVGTPADRRELPKGLDIMAAMGSARAYELLDEMGETRYENYPEQMEKMKVWLESLTVEEWTETLNNAWMFSFYPLLEVPGVGFPTFMQSPAWLDKQLHTSLGSWAELKHDTILYAKQVYAEMGGGPPPPPPLPPKGYVEPVPAFYARLKALTEMTIAGLEARGLLTELDRESLERLAMLVDEIQIMAEKELRGEPLTETEDERIRFFGGELEHLTMAAADTDAENPFAPRYMDEEPQAAVIADVATDPDHHADGVFGVAVLEEGVGRVNPIYVVVPIVEADGSLYLQVAKGGIFSYYEFVWPAEDRLTDEKWRQMLDDGEAPPPPEWINSFYVQEGEYAEIKEAVLTFQKALTSGYWNPAYGLSRDYPALDFFRQEMETLLSAKQYFGHQLVQSNIRSVDLQAEGLVVVTVREVWQDGLYQYQSESPNHYDEPLIGERGPYTLDITYTLEYVNTEYGMAWRVTRAVYGTLPPAWG
jgi:hypothetical protein